MKILKTLSGALHHIWSLSASGKKLFGPFLGLAFVFVTYKHIKPYASSFGCCF